MLDYLPPQVYCWYLFLYQLKIWKIYTFFSETHQLISGAQFMDFIQVGLDGLQVGEAVTTTKLQNHLQQERDETQVTQKKREKAVGKSLIHSLICSNLDYSFSSET